MQVNITFDTEREPIANLTKLRDAMNDLIEHRKKTHDSLNPLEQRAAMWTPESIDFTHDKQFLGTVLK